MLQRRESIFDVHNQLMVRFKTLNVTRNDKRKPLGGAIHFLRPVPKAIRVLSVPEWYAMRGLRTLPLSTSCILSRGTWQPTPDNTVMASRLMQDRRHISITKHMFLDVS
jgi:hypothetical protein